MYSKKEVARIFNSAARLIERTKEQEEVEVVVDKSRSIETNPLLERFSTHELKMELRRRRKESGLFRWILWKMEAWKLWEYF